MNAKSIGLIVLLAAGGGGIYAWRRSAGKPAKKTSEIVAVKEGPIENTVDATGSVAPLNRVEIKPPIAGRMENLVIDEGAHVKRGDIMAWMSSSDRAAILDAARAQGPEVLKHWEDAY